MKEADLFSFTNCPKQHFLFQNFVNTGILSFIFSKTEISRTVVSYGKFAHVKQTSIPDGNLSSFIFLFRT